MNKEEALELENKLNFSKVNLKVINTEEKKYAGGNRNNEVKKVVLGKKIFDILDKRKEPIYIYKFKVHHGHITIHKDINSFYGRKTNTMIYLDIPLTMYIELSKQ